MAAETRLLVFATQADAMAALAIMNKNLGIGAQANATTVSYAWPQAFAGDPAGQWYLPYPGDATVALAGVDQTTFFVSAGMQPVPQTVAASNLVAPLSLRDLITMDEKTAIYAAADAAASQKNYQLWIWIDDLSAAATADLSTAKIQQGFAALVAAGLVTAARAAAILAPVGILPQAQWTAGA